jgi:hypothetical protein
VGCVITTRSVSLLDEAGGAGAGAVLPLTLTVTLVLPVFPAASRTVAEKVRVPLATAVHGIVTGPREAAVRVPMAVPSTLSEKVFDDPLVPSTHSTAVPLPPMVAPLFGYVMNTRSEPPELAGGTGVPEPVVDPVEDPVAVPLSVRDCASPSTVKVALPANCSSGSGFARCARHPSVGWSRRKPRCQSTRRSVSPAD